MVWWSLQWFLNSLKLLTQKILKKRFQMYNCHILNTNYFSENIWSKNKLISKFYFCWKVLWFEYLWGLFLVKNVYMEAIEPKWVNFILNIVEANSLRLGGLHIFTHRHPNFKSIDYNFNDSNQKWLNYLIIEERFRNPSKSLSTH